MWLVSGYLIKLIASREGVHYLDLFGILSRKVKVNEFVMYLRISK